MKSRASLTIELLKQGSDPNAIAFRLALRDALAGCDSVLDIGCGVSAKLKQLGCVNTTGLEGYKPDFEEAKRQKTHDQLILGDAGNLLNYFQPKQFDAVIALDVIEHFTKDGGLKLMQEMETLAKKKVIFFTPSGFLAQSHASNDDLQEHLSGWEADEMKRHGYDVIGLLGPKSMRGEGHVLKKRPLIFWSLVAWMAHIFWTRSHPEKAAAIFCVKTLPTGSPQRAS